MHEKKLVLSKQVVDLNDPLMPLIEQTYVSSFPIEERRDFALLKDLLMQNKSFRMYSLQRDGLYVGFITAWFFDGFNYVEHFAIDESVRNGGLGSISMSSFLSICTEPVVLEVELPLDEMSKRRIGFYERLGFKLDNHYYLQPPYRPEDSPFELRLMSYGDLDMDKSFEEVKNVIHRNVYGVK